MCTNRTFCVDCGIIAITIWCIRCVIDMLGVWGLNYILYYVKCGNVIIIYKEYAAAGLWGYYGYPYYGGCHNRGILWWVYYGMRN